MMARWFPRTFLIFALALLPFAAGFAQETDAAKSDLKAAETLADQLQRKVDSELGGFGNELACQAQCRFTDSAGNCQRKLLRVEQEQRYPGCSWPQFGNSTEQQNIDVYMCNDRVPRNDWTTVSPCQNCSMGTQYYCSGTNLITRTVCNQNGDYRDSAPDVDHPSCGCASVWQGFSCSGSTGVYTNYCTRDNRVVSQSYYGSHPSCVPPPAYATLQSCEYVGFGKCGKYHCDYPIANMNCSGLVPGQQCIGAGSFGDGYRIFNAGASWCGTTNTYGCCVGWP